MRSSRYIVLERKSIPMVAWYMLSKESYMKRVIREVLPTFRFCQKGGYFGGGNGDSLFFSFPVFSRKEAFTGR